jgi:hypothetical protein
MEVVRTLVDRPKTWLKKTSLAARLRTPRRFHIFGVGANKTGTVSLARAFSLNYRAAHEPRASDVVSVILGRATNRIDETEYERFIIEHDRLTWLEMHSSHLNYDFLEILVRRFEEAKFVLTIRDCYSWIDSCFDQKLNTAMLPQPLWNELRNWRYGVGAFNHSKEERLLADRGLAPLDSYFSYWARHNSGALRTVPSDRLLVIRTDRLSTSMDALANLAGVSAATLDPRRIHSHKAPTKHAILAQLDPNFVRNKAEHHCGDLMQRFFPEISWPR